MQRITNARFPLQCVFFFPINVFLFKRKIKKASLYISQVYEGNETRHKVVTCKTLLRSVFNSFPLLSVSGFLITFFRPYISFLSKKIRRIFQCLTPLMWLYMTIFILLIKLFNVKMHLHMVVWLLEPSSHWNKEPTLV